MFEKKPNCYINAFNLVKDAVSHLYDEQEATAIAKRFLEETLHIGSYEIFLYPDHLVPEMHQDLLESGMARLAKGEPLQYVVGHMEFIGLEYKITPDVLIPRPETEELIWWVAADQQGKTISIVDIGTGSGCIAISLSRMLERATIYAIDISEEALAMARHNAEINKRTVHFIQNDILLNHNFLPDIPIDVIVSNPPYVTNKEKSQMHRNVLDHEPHLALFVPDEDPLRFYRAIAMFASSRSTPATVYLEVNEAYANETGDLFTELGFEVTVRKDFYGKERMVRATPLVNAK